MDGQAPAGGPFPGGDGQGLAPGWVPGEDFGLDPDLLEMMCAPEVLDGQALPGAFGQDGAADLLRPGPVLAALTARAAASAGSLSDDELVGVLQAARRMAGLAAYQQTVAIAEFARRRQGEFEAAKAAGVPVGCRDGEFPGAELAMELVDTRACAGARVDAAVELATRLPRTLAGMKAGAIDLERAMTIASRTRVMTGTDASFADEVLAAAAPELRPDQLARKAAALELKLAPGAVAARKDLARRLDQRVEARREDSGNASLSGRELGTADVIASKAHIDAIAAKLRDAGLDATLGQLRALALTDLTQGRNPLDRIKPQTATADAGAPAVAKADEHDDDFDSSPARAGDPAPLPALINLLVPAATLLGWGTAPAQATGWGLLDTGETQALVKAASRHPRTRWCVTVTGPDGTAIGHGCAAGQHPWPANAPPPPQSLPPQGPPGPSPAPDSPPPRAPDAGHGTTDTTTPEQAARILGLLERLKVTLEPVARNTCDHRHAEDRYVPSRKLKHLVRARNQTCTAPACNAQAIYSDLDHTVPHPDGPTDQCNLTPKCRRHHRTKQAPGWNVTQPTPDTTTWTTPSGRTHTTTATHYDL